MTGFFVQHRRSLFWGGILLDALFYGIYFFSAKEALPIQLIALGLAVLLFIAAFWLCYFILWLQIQTEYFKPKMMELLARFFMVGFGILYIIFLIIFCKAQTSDSVIYMSASTGGFLGAVRFINKLATLKKKKK